MMAHGITIPNDLMAPPNYKKEKKKGLCSLCCLTKQEEEKKPLHTCVQCSSLGESLLLAKVLLVLTACCCCFLFGAEGFSVGWISCTLERVVSQKLLWMKPYLHANVKLACRDYPHPRHLCAKFPFSATPHAKHCNLCHCYVCDSLAPCMYWGNGVSFADHCNSTDKEEVWRTQRQNSKQRIEAGPPVQRLPDATLSMRVPLHNVTRPPHSSSESLSIRLIPQQSSVSEPIKLHASATGFGTTTWSRPNPHLRFIRSRYPQSPSGSIRLIPRTHTNTRGRGGISAPGPQFVPPQSRFKGAGPSGSSAFTVLNQSGQGSFDGNHIYTVLQPKSQSMQATPGEDIHLKKLQNLLYGIDSELDTFLSTSGHNSNSNVTDWQSYSVSSLPQVQVHDLSLPQFENMNRFVNPAPNATEPDPSGFNYSWPLNVASESTPVDPTLSSVHSSEALTVMQSEGQHLQNLGSLEFHEENWVYNPMEHQPPIPENASKSMVSDLDFLSVQSPSADSLFYGFESSWVI